MTDFLVFCSECKHNTHIGKRCNALSSFSGTCDCVSGYALESSNMNMPQPSWFQQRIDYLKSKRKLMTDYLLHKFDNEDWHGVQDAASDLRDLDTELATLERISKG